MSAAMFPEAKRLNTWRELFGRKFLHLDVDPLDDEPFRYDVDYIAMPDLNLSSGSISAVRCNRTRELIDDGNDDLILLVPQSGKMELHERGKEVLVRQGDAFIRRSSEIGHTFSTSGKYLTLSIPSDKVAQRVANMEQFGFAVVQNGNHTLSLLKNYLQMLMSGNLVPPENDDLARYTAEMISRHIQEVVGLLLGGSRDAWEYSCEPGGGLFATRIAAIYAEVAHKATDPDFSVHDVAQNLEISPGYIRKLLATQEQRFSDLLRSARLDHAHRMLRAPHVIQMDITWIALESGFNDISYFNRCFKQRFGMTPSDVRNGLTDQIVK
jgi:AraC-like DNA-binding protein